MYRVENPVELNFYYRKPLFHKGRLYWTGYDVLHKVHEIYTTVIRKIHRTMRRIAHFERIACKIAKLEAPILIAVTALYVKALLYGCAMIALLN